jgi:MerR family mercuric resistance operon transcriptional regulator
VDGLTVSELARRAGVNAQTIRYYEREGLLPKPPRTAGGYRAFPGDSVARVGFIKRAQELGFSLREIAELLDLRRHPGSACPAVRSHADAKIAAIDRKIRELRAIRSELVRLTRACAGRARPHCCPILSKLESDGNPSHVTTSKG